MAKLRILGTAEADLIAIRLYSIREFGDEVADAYFRGFTKALHLLRDHPSAAGARPELGDDIRCLIHRRHRIFYSVDADVVIIRRIIHHAQSAQRALNL